MRDETELKQVRLDIKLTACPHCQGTGALIGHGLLRGYAEHGSELMVRGQRFFCSNRGLRDGCGRTFSVKLSTVLSGFVVLTLTLWCFVQAVLAGLTRRAAWLREGGGALSLSTGYRLWRRLGTAQSALRAQLSREAPAPACAAREPLCQLVAHLAGVVGSEQADSEQADLFSAYQNRLQRGVFDT